VLYLKWLIFLDSYIIIATLLLCYLLPSNTRKPLEAEKYVMDFYPVSSWFWLDCVNAIL